MSSPKFSSYAAIRAYKDKYRKDRPESTTREDNEDTEQKHGPKTPSPAKRRHVDEACELEESSTPSKKVARGPERSILTPTSIARRVALPPSPAQTIPAPTEGTTVSLPTPTPTPKKQQPIPKVADRYIPQTSTLTGIDYRDPSKFTVKPGYWQPWSSKEYATFAAHLRAQFDPEPFAQSTGRTVEEIQYVFTSLVVNPLYDAGEASRRGTEGMKETMEMFNNFSTPMRFWGKRHEDDCVMVSAELHCIADGGEVKLIDIKGSEVVMRLEDLSGRDVKYLKNKLTEEDKKKLWG